MEVPQDDAASKKRIWIRAGVHPQTTARPASAYRHQLSDSPAGGPRLSTIPNSNSQLPALADARTDSLPVSDKSDTFRHNETFYGNGSMQAQNSAEEQAPLHLWRAATQDSTLNQSTISLEESANLSQPRDVSTPGHRDERIVEDPREPRGSEPVTRYVNASSHDPLKSVQTGQDERRASLPPSLELAPWPQSLPEAGSDSQLIHWGKQVRRRKRIGYHLKNIRERKATLSSEAEVYSAEEKSYLDMQRSWSKKSTKLGSKRMRRSSNTNTCKWKEPT